MQTVLFSCMAIVVMLMWVTGLWLRLGALFMGRSKVHTDPARVVPRVLGESGELADLDAPLTSHQGLLPPSRHPVG